MFIIFFQSFSPTIFQSYRPTVLPFLQSQSTLEFLTTTVNYSKEDY